MNRIEKIAVGAVRGLFLLPVIVPLIVACVPFVDSVVSAQTSVSPTEMVYIESELPESVTVSAPMPGALQHDSTLYTFEETEMLAKLVYEEARGVTDEKWGISGKARQAAVIWCVLNRVDDGAWGDTIAEVVTYPEQFAYCEDAPIEIELLNLAADVLSRWETEKNGEATVGRTLPREYLYFGAEYGENYFRTDYYVLGDNWDWSLPDPYATAME